MSHTRDHGVVLWNCVTVDWLSVGMWFGTYSACGVTMWPHGLVYSLLLFSPSHVVWYALCLYRKGEWVEHSVASHELRDDNNVLGSFML